MNNGSDYGQNYWNLSKSKERLRQKINENRGITKEDEMLDMAAKSIKTTMIGSLSKFEDAFGDFWGEFKDEEIPLTEEEERLLVKFEQCRKSILDLGNNEIRRLGCLFSQFKDKK